MTFTEKAKFSRFLVLVGILTLVMLLGFSPISLILLIFIPGLLAKKYRSGSFLCFALLIYFMFATLNLFNDGNLLRDSIIMAVIVLLFVVSMFYARWQQRANIFEGETKSG